MHARASTSVRQALSPFQSFKHKKAVRNQQPGAASKHSANECQPPVDVVELTTPTFNAVLPPYYAGRQQNAHSIQHHEAAVHSASPQQCGVVCPQYTHKPRCALYKQKPHPNCMHAWTVPPTLCSATARTLAASRTQHTVVQAGHNTQYAVTQCVRYSTGWRTRG